MKAPYNEPCADCLRTLPILSEPQGNEIPGVITLAPLKYCKQVRSGIHGMKFRLRTAGTNYFARLMTQTLTRYNLCGFDTVTWVPVSLGRRRIRGYDQSELLARAVAKMISVKARRLIRKARNTNPNSLLKTAAERRENVDGAFRLAPFAQTDGAILLIDDVMTTGSTAAECVKLLTLRGASNIVVLTLARAQQEI